MFLQNILQGDSTPRYSDDVAVVTGGQNSPAYMEKRAVDLLIGRYVYLLSPNITENVRYIQGILN